jgi:NAD-dependent SIR2 family protein deacetylase
MHGKHKKTVCVACGKTKRSDHFSKGSKQCTVCSKGKAKTVVNVPVSNHLDANALAQLPSKHDIGPNDSLSVIGGKR